ncbi:hypothetical protein YC2023_054822 [Brassica napus]
MQIVWYTSGREMYVWGEDSRIKRHWTRISEPVGGRLSYKPPIYDINAPDLYIPFMAFGTYVVLADLSPGLNGK